MTGHVVFPGRDHYTCGEPGWEAVADFALQWALEPPRASSIRPERGARSAGGQQIDADALAKGPAAAG